MTATADTPTDALDSTRGWVLVAVAVCVLVAVWGVVFSFTVYAGHLGDAFGLTALQTSSVFSITTALLLVAGGVVGVLAARLPLRPVVAAGGVGLAVAGGLVQVVGSYAGVAAAFAVLGASGGAVFTVLISLVPQWFDAQRGRATGVTMTGTGLGVLVMPFVWLRLFDVTGFRTAFGVVVAATVAVVLVASPVCRRPRGRSGGGTVVDAAWLRETLADRRFQSTVVGYALLWAWYYVLSARLVDVLTAGGIDAATAAAAFGTIGGVSILSRVGSGVVGDRVGRRETFAAGVVLAGACVLALPAVHSTPALYAVLACLGIGNGALASLWSPIVLTRFGPGNGTALVGLLNVTTASVAFLAPLAVGVARDALGGYALPLLALAAVTFLGVAFFHWGTASPNG